LILVLSATLATFYLNLNQTTKKIEELLQELNSNTEKILELTKNRTSLNFVSSCELGIKSLKSESSLPLPKANFYENIIKKYNKMFKTKSNIIQLLESNPGF
jgi:hypothetical protein